MEAATGRRGEISKLKPVRSEICFGPLRPKAGRPEVTVLRLASIGIVDGKSSSRLGEGRRQLAEAMRLRRDREKGDCAKSYNAGEFILIVKNRFGRSAPAEAETGWGGES